jgi:hypothetical protein
MQTYAQDYNSFSGALNGEGNRVKFIYKTDSIGG